MNYFCLTTFLFNNSEVRLALSVWFFLVEGYQVTFDIQIDLKIKHPKLCNPIQKHIRTLSNIQDGGFCINSERLLVFYYICKKLNLRYFASF